MSDSLHAPNAEGFFPILVLHRDDVASAVSNYGPDPLCLHDHDYEDTTSAADAFAAALTDEQMEYLAKKLGDDLMNGGEFYEALSERAIDQHWTGA